MKTHFDRSFLKSSIVVIGVLAMCIFSQAAEPTTRQNDGWTFDKIVAALQWREAQMAESTLKFTETVYEINSGGGREFVQRTVATMYRHAGVTRCSVDMTHGGEAAVLNGSFEQQWDGKACRAFIPKVKNKKYASASVIATVPPVLDNTQLLALIGFSETGGALLSTQILKVAEEQAPTLSITMNTVDGERVVKLLLDRPCKGFPDSQEFWFLPDKDFMPIYYKIEGWPSDQYVGKPTYVRVLRAEGSQKRGMWTPDGFSSDLWSKWGKGAYGLESQCNGKLLELSLARPARTR